MNYYQIYDTEGDEMGIIMTELGGVELHELQSRMYAEDEPDDISYMDLLEEKVQDIYPDSGRIYLDKIYA